MKKREIQAIFSSYTTNPIKFEEFPNQKNEIK